MQSQARAGLVCSTHPSEWYLESPCPAPISVQLPAPSVPVSPIGVAAVSIGRSRRRLFLSGLCPDICHPAPVPPASPRHSVVLQGPRSHRVAMFYAARATPDAISLIQGKRALKTASNPKWVPTNYQDCTYAAAHTRFHLPVSVSTSSAMFFFVLVQDKSACFSYFLPP